MSSVFEFGSDVERLTRDEAAVPNHVLILKLGLACDNANVAFPSVVAVDGSVAEGDSGAISHALGDAIAESIHSGGSICCQGVEGLGGRENLNVVVAIVREGDRRRT